MAKKRRSQRSRNLPALPTARKGASLQKKPIPKRKSFPIFIAAGVALALAIVLTAGGFTFAATQEEHDTFCASCHTQPESTFFQRSTAAQPTDLASFHTTKSVRCIDCHSGVGITGRMSAELLGAHNALAWYSGTAVQPAKLTVPIRDDNCLKCHGQVTVGGGLNNHFHEFLVRWQAIDPNAGTCVSCHPGHSTDGNAQTGFQNQANTEAVCQACHSILGGGE